MAISEVYFEDMGNGLVAPVIVSDLEDEDAAADESDLAMERNFDALNIWGNLANKSEVVDDDLMSKIAAKIVSWGVVRTDGEYFLDLDYKTASLDEWLEWSEYHVL